MIFLVVGLWPINDSFCLLLIFQRLFFNSLTQRLKYKQNKVLDQNIKSQKIWNKNEK